MPRRCCGGLSPVDDQGPVQQLAAEASDPPLGDGVRPGSLDRCAHDCDGLGGEDGVERGGELAVPVPDQEAEPGSPVAEIGQQVPGAMGDPRPGRVGGDAELPYPLGGDLDDEQDVQPAQQHDVDVGEVAGQDALGLAGQELPPALPDSPGRYRPGGGSARPCRAPAGGRARPVRHEFFGSPSRDSPRPSAAPTAGWWAGSAAGRRGAEPSTGGGPNRDASAAPSPA